MRAIEAGKRQRVAALANFVLGDGNRPAVMLHGFLGSGRNLRTLATRWLATDPTRKLLLVDLPGHGDSRPARADETLQTMASSVIETARSVGFEGPLTWVGHSLGGRVSLAAIDADVEAVESVVMLDIGPSPIPPATSESNAVLEVLRRASETAKDRSSVKAFLTGEGLSLPIAEWLMTNLVSIDGGVKWKFDREALRRLQDRVNAQDLWPIVEDRLRPMGCIRGKRSRYLSVEDLERMKTYGVEVDEVNAGHFVHVDALEELVPKIVAMVR